MDFKKYISGFITSTGSGLITHQSFPAVGYRGGKYSIPDDSLDSFYKIYYKALVAGEIMYLMEKVTDTHFAFFLDIEVPRGNTSLILTIDNIKTIITKTTKILKENFIDVDAEFFVSKRNDKYHINFPKVIVNGLVATEIAKMLIVDLNLDAISQEMDGKVIDISVYRTNLRLLGSRKSETDCDRELDTSLDPSKWELVYQPFDLTTNAITKISDMTFDLFKNYIVRRIVGTELSKYKNLDSLKTSTKTASTGTVVSGLSLEIRSLFKMIDLPDGVSLAPIVKITTKNNKSNLACYYVSLGGTSICPFKEREHSRASNPVYIEINQIGISVKCHDSDCITKKYPDIPIPFPKTFSTDCPKLNAGLFLKITKGPINLTPALVRLLEESLSQSHYRIAKVVFHIFKDRFRLDDIKNPDWYEFEGNKWKKTHIMNILISEELQKYYRAIKVKKEQNESTDESTDKSPDESPDVVTEKKEESDANMRNGLIDSIINKLENVTFKKNILNEMYFLFKNLEPDFISKLDSNPWLIGFKDGVYDLKTCEFRNGLIDDYITFSTGYEYINYNPELPEIKAIYHFLSQIIPNKKVMEYLLKILGRGLLGIADEHFYIFTGIQGANGKSTLINFLEYTLGDYTTGVDVSLLTNKRAMSSSASPDVIRLRGKRLVSFAEPEMGDTLKTGILKAFSGGDSIIARELYKAPVSFKLQATMIMCCNDLPALSSNDGGTSRRIRVIDFKSRFCDNPKKKNEFLIDPNIKENIKNWRPYFMSMLIHYYKIYNQELALNNRIEEPAEVLAATEKYKVANDKFNDYFTDCVMESTIPVSVKIVYTNFVSWWTDNSFGKKIPDITELVRAMKIKYGEEDYNKHKGFMVSLNLPCNTAQDLDY